MLHTVPIKDGFWEISPQGLEGMPVGSAYGELIGHRAASRAGGELPNSVLSTKTELYPHMLIRIASSARKRWRNCNEKECCMTVPAAQEIPVVGVFLRGRPRDILNPFALEKEIPLKESLEAHAIRLAKKKGVKGKAILCGVGAAHIPRSDGVPVSVATVSPKDSELLGKLEEAGDAAYQVGSSEQSRCHSI
ncbi:hypothetical protein Tco_0955733 [Tanacetum coccineum]|uniref:Uncharacterized protein n=1 Tax=Tanacetum coccineum TaxID=301880 RepID=A0ABQ5E873_9ASTR